MSAHIVRLPLLVVLAAVFGVAAWAHSASPSPASSRRLPPRVLPSGHLFVYVRMPVDMPPTERGRKFEDPLDEALQAAGLGEVSGGGSEMGRKGPDGRQSVVAIGIDVDLTNGQKGVPFLKQRLIRLGAPKGTVLQFELAGVDVEEPLE